MPAFYIAKRIMESIRQFNADSEKNYELLKSTFETTDASVVGNNKPGRLFSFFEDNKAPDGFLDELGITKKEYPDLYEQLKNYKYSIKVNDYVYSYKYNNRNGIGTTSVTVKEVVITVKDPHRKKFTLKMLLARAHP